MDVVRDTNGNAERGRLAALVAQARRDAGFTQAELAGRTGLTLGEIDRMERGRADPQPHVEAIAQATNKPSDWFLAPPVDAHPDGDADVDAAAGDGADAEPGSNTGRQLVIVAFVLIIVIRLFTEVIPVVPRFFNFIDVPLFVLLVGAALVLRPEPPIRPLVQSPYFGPAVATLALCTLSVLVSLSRVAPPPALLFVYGFLGPVAVYYATYRIWRAGGALTISRMLVALGILQFAVVATISLPRALAQNDPDEISGTFGEGPYQLVFHLLVLAALLAGIATFEPKRPAARFAPILFGACFLVIFLAQYRSLLVTTALTVVGIGLLLGAVRGRGVAVGAAIIAACVAGLTFVAAYFPVTKFQPTIEAFSRDPTFFVETRLGAGSDIVDLYADNPLYIVTGTGPGTFSSRAWRTFAELESTSDSDVAGPYVRRLFGERAYQTDVSEKYVVARLERREILFGSRALTQPYSSYFALLAEIGVLGFALVIGVYVAVVVRAGRMALAAMRATVPGDPLPALLLAVTIGFAVLLQLAIFDNWLEVARVTIPMWILLAVATKEFEARAQGATA